MASEYENMIDATLKRIGKRKEAADAKAFGEAQRRGLVGQTGTSDIEYGLREASARPYAEAEATTIADLLRQKADKEREERMIGEERTYGTSEREATQDWRGELSRFLQAQDALNQAKMEGYVDPTATGLSDPTKWQGYTQTLGTPGEGKGTTWYGRAGQAERGRGHEYGIAKSQADWNKPKKKSGWRSFLEGAAGGLGMAGGMALTSALGPAGGMAAGALGRAFAPRAGAAGSAGGATMRYGGKKYRPSTPPAGNAWYNR